MYTNILKIKLYKTNFNCNLFFKDATNTKLNSDYCYFGTY